MNTKKKKKKRVLRHMVTKPSGITWEGTHYAYGQLLPRSVVAHPKFPVLLRIGYIAAADSPLRYERQIHLTDEPITPTKKE